MANLPWRVVLSGEAQAAVPLQSIVLKVMAPTAGPALAFEPSQVCLESCGAAGNRATNTAPVSPSCLVGRLLVVSWTSACCW